MAKEIQPLSEYEGIRRIWDEQSGEYWFAIVDVIEILSESPQPAVYWRQMKSRELKDVVPFWNGFPMKHKKNNRTYKTDCANQHGLLRLVQSIPSKKAEPFRQWLAITGNRRLKEMEADPIEMQRERYRLQGYDENWINTRLESQSIRNELTDEWRGRGVQDGAEFGMLTNEIHKGTFEDMSVKDHKEHKSLKKRDSLRDHMTPIELAFTILGEASTLEEIKEDDPKGFEENKRSAKKGGETAGKLRKLYEEETGRPVISDQSYLEQRRRLASGENGEDIGDDDEEEGEG